ncbi:c-type cytochrome [Thalassoroseus pseudoceratinae]|uniref:c-type cytochrome n=1 Tax=Thalassoroseus pseudoceratinae TaxID=2713176 RepID=UPI001420A1FE|nr:c-type cytochrome [Thalassoroseus pseudoceratinae]
MKTRWIVLATLSGALVLGGLGAFLFLHSGLYNIGAIHQHLQMERTLILTLKRNSVEAHAQNLEVPELNKPQLVRRGFVLYRKNCVACHGGPGEPRSRIGMGLNPNPPPLEKAADRWTSAEIAWIITHGLKMAGMPGFAMGEEPKDLWAITAFVMRLNTLTPAEYHDMLAATEDDGASEEVAWLAPEQGWQKLADEGNKSRGKDLTRKYGCGTCHQILGINGANGAAGPPLTNWGKRHYIAGTLNNSPRHLVTWLRNSQDVEPGTVMPNLNIPEDDAWDIAAYLLALGRDD